MSAEIAPEVANLWPHIEKLLREMAVHPHTATDSGWPHYSEAYMLVALLPEPVDEDLREVLRLAEENGVWLSDDIAQAIVAYFKGAAKRELERGQ